MSKTKTKRYLVLLAAIGLVAAALGGTGTFASFNAEVTNTGNTFATGSLILNDNGGTNTCTSAGDVTNANNASTNGCDTLFTIPKLTSVTGTLSTALTTSPNTTQLNFSGGLTGGSIDAGDSLVVTSGTHTQTFTATAGADATDTSVTVTSVPATFAFPVGSTITDQSNTHYARLTLTNAGTLDASDIKFDMPSCGNAAAEGSSTLTGSSLSGAVTSLSFAALTGSFHIGDPIVVTSGSHTQTFIASSAAAPGATTVNVQSQVANFAYPSGSTVSGPTFTPAGNLCNGLLLSIVETDSSFDHSVGNPATGCAYGTGSAPAGLGCVLGSGTALSSVPSSPTALSLASNGGSGNTGTNLSASGSRYFLIAVKQPSASLNNTFQNRAATFDLLWHIDQA